MFPKTTSRLKLRSGAHVAIIGGGPAGSFFSLFALHYARQAGLDLRITVFEPRDFSRLGPWGCNMCAGLIPTRDLQSLASIGVKVPQRVIRARITHYTLHTVAGHLRLPQPAPDGDVISVYRGQGPRDVCPWSEHISFDRFLLETVRSHGAALIPQPVKAISLRPRPVVTTRHRTIAADLVVLAAGVNRRAVHFTDLAYRPPPRQQMAQAELYPGSEAVQTALGDSVHIFLPSKGDLTFGTLVPKEACISVSLLGSELSADSLKRFLTLPEVTALLPEGSAEVCGCRPHIAVGQAQPLYADRFVAVGDAGITRLYKNGIGSALQAARQAAKAAVQHGIDAPAFRRHFAPLCREIVRDNRAGHLLFAFTRFFQRHALLIGPHLHAIAAEQALPPDQRLHSRLLWGMFTGIYPYRQLLAMACHLPLHVRLLRNLLQNRAFRRSFSPAEAKKLANNVRDRRLLSLDSFRTQGER